MFLTCVRRCEGSAEILELISYSAGVFPSVRSSLVPAEAELSGGPGRPGEKNCGPGQELRLDQGEEGETHRQQLRTVRVSQIFGD